MCDQIRVWGRSCVSDAMVAGPGMVVMCPWRCHNAIFRHECGIVHAVLAGLSEST